MNSINEELLSAYQTAGATSVNINDAEAEVLIAQGAADGKWDTFLRAQGLSGSTNDMLMEYLTGRGYSGSINEMIIAAANADDLFTPTVSAFDPATLSWTSGRKRQWWHVDEATFKNGTPDAVVGDPISRVVTQSAGGGGVDFDMILYAGSAFVLRSGYVEGTTGVYLTSLGGFYPKTTGLTIAARVRWPSAQIFLGGEDYSPLYGFQLRDIASYPGTLVLNLDCDGNASTNEISTTDLASIFADDDYHNVAAVITPEASGNCPVKLYIDDGANPVATGTFSGFNSSFSRDIVSDNNGGTKIKSRFYAMQDFNADMPNIFNFLTNGSGV